MKDGTELTHYGVKGMKWGKSKNKPKGAFGKPSAGHETTIDSINAAAAKKVNTENDVFRKGKISYANLANRTTQAINVGNSQKYRKQAEVAKEIGLSGKSQMDKAHYWANRAKRGSKRINGR